MTSKGRAASGRKQESVNTGPTYELAEWLNANIPRRTDETNEVLASTMGYARSNIISMWRTGKSRVPLERLPDISRLLNVSIAELLPMWMEQYAPAMRVEVAKLFGRLVTDNEFEIIQAVREASHSQDPKATKRDLAAIKEVMKRKAP